MKVDIFVVIVCWHGHLASPPQTNYGLTKIIFCVCLLNKIPQANLRLEMYVNNIGFSFGT